MTLAVGYGAYFMTLSTKHHHLLGGSGTPILHAIMVLIWIFLVANNVEHLFMPLLTLFTLIDE